MGEKDALGETALDVRPESRPLQTKPSALGDTALDSQPGTRGAADKPPIALAMRATVLPRLDRTRRPEGHVAPVETPRFEPMKLLGRGGVGEVTLARDNDIDRPVAVKRLRADAVTDEGLHRFVHEIRTVGQLEHPNITPIHDVGIDDHGQHYFVMRYIEGETLDVIIAKLAAGDREYHRRYTFEARVAIFADILNAIDYAHSKQILHRDLKPSNIMVGPFGEVMVMDWGIAKQRGSSDEEPVALAATLDQAGRVTSVSDSIFRTRHGTLLGTPAYMSPEQAAGRTGSIDERSDVYALCVIFYELLALQHYLPGRTTLQEMLASIMKDSHEMAGHIHSPHQPLVPAELAWYVETGLAKDPAQRFQSVREMIEQLLRVMSGEFRVQCYVTFMRRSGEGALKLMQVHPRVALGLIVLLVAIFIAGVVAGVAWLLA